MTQQEYNLSLIDRGIEIAKTLKQEEARYICTGDPESLLMLRETADLCRSEIAKVSTGPVGYDESDDIQKHMEDGTLDRTGLCNIKHGEGGIRKVWYWSGPRAISDPTATGEDQFKTECSKELDFNPKSGEDVILFVKDDVYIGWWDRLNEKWITHTISDTSRIDHVDGAAPIPEVVTPLVNKRPDVRPF